MIRDLARSSTLIAAVLLCGAVSVAAQGTDTAAAQGYAPSPAPEAPAAKAEVGSVGGTIIVPTRSPAAIDEALRVSQLALARADSELTSATARRAKAQQAVQGVQRSLAENAAKRDQADKEKRSADKKSLEAEKKALERRKNLAEQVKSLNDAEVDAATKGREAAIARQQALDLERMLIEKRSGGASSAVISEARAPDPGGAEESDGSRAGPRGQAGLRGGQAAGSVPRVSGVQRAGKLTSLLVKRPPKGDRGGTAEPCPVSMSTKPRRRASRLRRIECGRCTGGYGRQCPLVIRPEHRSRAPRWPRRPWAGPSRGMTNPCIWPGKRLTAVVTPSSLSREAKVSPWARSGSKPASTRSVGGKPARLGANRGDARQSRRCATFGT